MSYAAVAEELIRTWPHYFEVVLAMASPDAPLTLDVRRTPYPGLPSLTEAAVPAGEVMDTLLDPAKAYGRLGHGSAQVPTTPMLEAMHRLWVATADALVTRLPTRERALAQTLAASTRTPVTPWIDNIIVYDRSRVSEDGAFAESLAKSVDGPGFAVVDDDAGPGIGVLLHFRWCMSAEVRQDPLFPLSTTLTAHLVVNESGIQAAYESMRLLYFEGVAWALDHAVQRKADLDNLAREQREAASRTPKPI